MPMITNDWLLSLTPAILEYINISMPQEESVIPRLFGVRNSANYMERVGTSGGINSATWLEYKMSGQVGGDSPSPLYYKDFTRKNYPLDIFADIDLLETSPLNVLQDAASAVGLSAFQRREEDAASVFANAFSSSFVGPDAVALCSTSHPVSASNGTVQSNKGTTALSVDAVRDTRTAMRKFKDDRNNPIMIMPDTLLVPPDLEDTAIRIVNSDALPGSANNDINPQRGRFQVIVWPFLTDTNNWFMIDSRMSRQYLRWVDFKPLTVNFKDVNQVKAKWEAIMSYDLGAVDWRWIYGHEVS